MPADPDLLAQLRPVRLPADFAAFAWTDVLAAASLGILAALALLVLLRLLTRRRETPLALVRRQLAAARALPAEDRLFRQAALLDRLGAQGSETTRRPPRRTGGGGDATAETRARIRRSLYRPGAQPDLDAIDAAILALARRAGRLGWRP